MVFLPQIGRGLRKHDGKKHLNVVDLIGNHKSLLLPARILLGLKDGNPASMRNLCAQLSGKDLELPAGCEVDCRTGKSAHRKLLHCLAKTSMTRAY